MNTPESRLVRVFAAVLKKNGCPDPLQLAASLVDRLKDEEEISVDATDTPVDFPDPDMQRKWDAGRPRVEPIRPPKPGAPPAEEKRMVITPEDPEFAAALNQTEGDRRAALATSGVRLSKVGHPTAGAGAEAVKHWTYEGIIQKIQENCPPEIWFTPNGYEASVKFRATMNFQAMLGLDYVRLKYNAGTSEDHMVPNPGGESRVVIGLDAVHDFRLTDNTLDFGAAIEDITVKLKGLYHKRDGTYNPVEPALPFGDLRRGAQWNAKSTGMREDADYEMPADREIVTDPHGEVLGSVIQQNQTTGNRNK